MKLRLLETLENQRVIIFTSMRGKFLKARQMITAVDNCKIEKFENNWWTLSFFDVISQSDVKIRRRAGSVRILGPDDKTVDIRGFERFTNRPKRVRTKRVEPVKAPMNLDQYDITRVDPNYYTLGKPYTPAFGGGPFPIRYETYPYPPADRIGSLLAEASSDVTLTTSNAGVTISSSGDIKIRSSGAIESTAFTPTPLLEFKDVPGVGSIPAQVRPAQYSQYLKLKEIVAQEKALA